MTQEDWYIIGPAKTVTVTADGSVSLLAEDVKPTSGVYAGMQAEVATIAAVGALYMETGGGDATAASYPMAATDVVTIEGYYNIKRLRFIRKVGDTSIVWLPSYR